jgi:hypothetical protein
MGERSVTESLLREDGEQIIIYADRVRLLLRALPGLALAMLFLGGGLWGRSIATGAVQAILILLSFGFMLCLTGVLTLLLLIRTGMTSPTLIVNVDGILDNCSMIVAGRGLLRWSEILRVEERVLSPKRGYTQRFLDIYVVDLRAIDRCQPGWQRVLAILAQTQLSRGLRFPRPLLDRPPSTLVTEINRYVHAHVPEGSWHKAVMPDEAEQPDTE